jgi:hypothetical protein
LNNGIAASRAGRCYLRLRLSVSFGCGKDKHLWAFVCYLLLLYLYSAAVGGRHSNEFPACSNTRPLNATKNILLVEVAGEEDFSEAHSDTFYSLINSSRET